jgi:hypothetical protein
MPIAREPLGEKREVVAYGYDLVVVRPLNHPELQPLIDDGPDRSTVYAASRRSVTTNTRRGTVYVRPQGAATSRAGAVVTGARSVAVGGAFSGIISTGDNAVVHQSVVTAAEVSSPNTLYLYVPDGTTVETADGDIDDQRIQ